ncbi:MAG: hypothetical protein ACFFBP_20885 [Promethearchaeota archaeon]
MINRNDNKEEGREVRVKDALKEDAGKGRIRIDPNLIKDLNLKNGDVIKIFHPTSKKDTAALLYPGKAEDLGSNAIRIDQSLRRNLGASLDNLVEIRKIKASEATKITFAGLEETVVIRNTKQLAQKLENRIITKGDILSFYAMGKRVDLIVVDYLPKVKAVRILSNTQIHLSEKVYKDLKELEKKEDHF